MDEEQERWGTWEELVLGSAVDRHGTNSWDLVSRELQLRSASPYGFSPEACKAKYVALQGRFNGCKDSDRNDDIMSLLEELRRLRVDQLRRELQRSNDSIGSLQSKLEKLRADAQSESLPFHTTNDNNGRNSEHARQRGENSDERSKDRSSAGSFIEGQHIRIERPDDGELNSVPEDGKDNKPFASTGEAANEEKKTGDWVSDGAPKDAYLLQQQQQVPQPPQAQPSSPLDSFYGSSETLADEREQKRSRHHNFGESKNSDIEGRQVGADLAVANNEGVDNLRPKKQQPARRPRTRHVLIPQRPRAEDLDSSKRDRAANEAPDGQILAKSEPDRGSLGTDTAFTEDSEMHTADTNVSERSSELARSRRRRRGRRKRSKGSAFKARDVHSETSRCKNKEMEMAPIAPPAEDGAEGSAESMETANNKAFKEEESRREDLQSDVLSSANPGELSSRQGPKALSTSHEASGIARGHYKECEDYLDAWNHTTRSSGDSHIERCESQMEGTEEMSPMSKRSRREPKVPGKLLPLLECLRTITSHKFGGLFKHRLQSQDTPQYRSMIRRHMDLGMIRSKLEEGSYACSLEFFRDLLLVFNNALIYYPKGCQEFAAAWMLRQLATKEMANIFQTEALLKQEGPSTRKREPRKALESSANAFRFNPTVGRKRNARPSGVGRALGRPKSARLPSEQSSAAGVYQKNGTEKHQAENGTGEIIKQGQIGGHAKEEGIGFTPQKPKPEGGPEQKSAASVLVKMEEGSTILAEATAAKTSGIGIDPPKGFSSEKNKVFDNTVDPRTSSTTDAVVEPRKISIDRGNSAGKRERHANPPPPPPSETLLLPPSKQHPAQQSRSRELAPPIKRGVGRPPKHAQKQPKAGADSETPSKSRKRARR